MTSSCSGKPRSRMSLRRTPQRPVAAGEARLQRGGLFAGRDRLGQAQVSGAAIRAVFRPAAPSRRLAGAVHQAQMLHVSKAKTATSISSITVRRRLCFHGAQALLAKRAAQRVDLAHDFAQRVVGRAPRVRGRRSRLRAARRADWREFAAGRQRVPERRRRSPATQPTMMIAKVHSTFAREISGPQTAP